MEECQLELIAVEGVACSWAVGLVLLIVLLLVLIACGGTVGVEDGRVESIFAAPPCGRDISSASVILV